MIEISADEYVSLVADVIAVLSTMDKAGDKYLLKVWYNNCDLPFEFDSNCFIEFLQEGLKVDDAMCIKYLWYDSIEAFMVERIWN